MLLFKLTKREFDCKRFNCIEIINADEFKKLLNFVIKIKVAMSKAAHKKIHNILLLSKTIKNQCSNVAQNETQHLSTLLFQGGKQINHNIKNSPKWSNKLWEVGPTQRPMKYYFSVDKKQDSDI